MKKRVSFFTLGCKLNFAETSSLANTFEQKGYARVREIENSDIIIINTCSVTSLAEKKGRNIISKARRSNPNAKIIALGCYAQLRPEELKKLNTIDLILGNQEKFKIFEYLENTENETIFRQPYKKIDYIDTAWSSSDRTRTFLKIQDGCSYFCAYCTIPMARGLSRSPDIETVIKSIKEIMKSGACEIVLTGVNIGDFGKQHNQTFGELIEEILRIPNLPRIRLGSIEPNLLTDKIIRMAANSKAIMPHFHIPLQCGTDEMLKKMNRRYTTEVFANRVKTIKEQLPDALIAADVIVGVPGETEAHHQQAMSFIQSLDISYLHVFTYSERPGTKAAQMAEQVDKQTRNKRSRQMHELSDKLKIRFINQQLGKKHDALFENEIKNGFIYGYTDNYLQVKVSHAEELQNNIKEVKLLKTDNNGTIEVEIL